MPRRDEERDLAKEVNELKKVQEEYIGTTGKIVETLRKLKKTQKEYIGLVKEHQNYWTSELEKTKYEDTVRRKKLKKTLKNEEKILEKLQKELKHTDERIEFHKKHVRH